jgi:hypothetical protein
LEFDTEEGEMYSYCVEEEVKANRLKLAKDSQRKVDDYENFFQIGAIVEVRWSKEEAVDTNLLPGKLNKYYPKYTHFFNIKVTVYLFLALGLVMVQRGSKRYSDHRLRHKTTRKVIKYNFKKFYLMTRIEWAD